MFGQEVLSSIPTSVAGSILGTKAMGMWVAGAELDAPEDELRFVRPGLDGAKSPRAEAEYDARSFFRRPWMFSTISARTVGVEAVMLMITGFVGGLPSSMGVVRRVKTHSR